MFCHKCGKALPEDAKFCNACGSDVSATQASESAQPVAPAQPVTPVQPYAPAAPVKEGKKKSTVIIVIGAVVIVALVAVLLVVLLGGKGKSSGDSGTNQTTRLSVIGEANEQKQEGISDNYHSGEIMVDGVMVKMPMKLSEFLDLGWNFRGDNGDLEPKLSSSNRWSNYQSLYLVKGQKELFVTVHNWTNRSLPLADCSVTSFDVETDDGIEIVIPGGFKLGDACKDDLLSAWGKVDYSNNTSGSVRYDFEVNDDIEYNLYFDESTGVLQEVVYYNESARESVSSADKVWYVDKNAAEAIQNKDTFPVQVTNVQFIEDGLKEGRTVNPNGDDAFVMEIKNDSGKKITGVEVLAIGYKNDGSAIKVQSNLTSFFLNSDPYISLISNEGDFDVLPGTSEKLALRVKMDDYAGGFAFIYKYTDESGTTHENPLAQEWADSMYK